VRAFRRPTSKARPATKEKALRLKRYHPLAIIRAWIILVKLGALEKYMGITVRKAGFIN
jgi:hypothetical protein